MDTVEHAQNTLAELDGKLAATNARAVELAVERRKLSFAAHNNDAGASKELTKLNSLSTTIAFEIENLKSAIDEGKRRLADAQLQADLAKRKADALHVKEVAGRISAHGPAITAALDTLRDSFIALTGDLRAARELGCEIVPSRLVELSFAEAISSALRPAGLTLLDLAPPHRRFSPEVLTASYADTAAAWAASVLGESKTELV